MTRFLVAFVTMMTLLVASRIYSAVITPMIAIATSQETDFKAEETAIRPPAMFDQQAMEHFPEVKWTHQAEHAWQVAEAVTLYFREHHRVAGSGNTLQISPIAVLWKDPKRPGSPPYRLVAERAQIKFQNSFFDSAISLTDAQPGRIVWGSLEGNVSIDGPDGLKIQGLNFKFDEEALQLYSDFPIKFEFGPTPQDQRKIAGSANQLQLTFLPASESVLGKDMPRISGLSQILLRRNVVLDTTFAQKGEGHHLRLTSNGSLLYDVTKRECTIDDQVQVVHATNKLGSIFKDAITCEWLRLLFDQQDPKASEEGSLQKSFDGLILNSIQAQGSLAGKGTRLKLTSDEHEMAAVMQDLNYNAIERRAVLVDQEHVIVQRGETTFQCPQIGIQHSVEKTLEYLECRGPGQMEVYEERFGDHPLLARWASKVTVQPDPESKFHIVHVEENAQFSVPDQFGLGCDSLQLWVDINRLQSQNNGLESGGNALAKPLPIKRVRAEGRVRVESALLKVARANLIDALISPGLLEAKTPGTSSPGSESPKSAEEEQTQSPWIVEADQISLDLVHDSGKALLDFRQIIGQGQVLVRHTPDKPMTVGSQTLEGPITLSGSTFTADNQGGVRQVLTLRGQTDPQGQIQKRASISLGTANVWGGQITLSRHENRIDIPGPGGMSLPIPQSATSGFSPSTPNSAPHILDIIWGEGMKFDGSAIRFWGKITASLPGEQESISRLLCEELTATLNQKVSFAEPQNRSGSIGIETLTGRHNVVLEAFEYQQTKLSAVHRAEVATFDLNQMTGDFKGSGPGEFHSWTAGDQVRFSPSESPQANQPAKASKTNWRYAGVKFAGKIEGNIGRNEAILSDRVEVITAPVPKPMVKFQRNQLSEKTPEAENAVWMKCQQLRIVRKMIGQSKTGMVEAFATGNAELEGHVFHAYADELTYDERRGMFVMRGLGRDATLYHQRQIGEPSRNSSAQVINFNPSKWDISFGGLTGVNGSY